MTTFRPFITAMFKADMDNKLTIREQTSASC